MSVEKNKAFVREYIEQVWNQHRPDLAGKYLAEDVNHINNPDLNDLAGVKGFIVSTLSSFPDFKVGIDALIGEGDQVVLSQTISGTQNGEFMGKPASGKKFTAPAVFILRIADGKITEISGMADAMSMMVQLGVVPVPEAA